MTTTEQFIADAIQRSKDEIITDINDGLVPFMVRDFGTLHNYVDANEYGGLCDEDIVATFPLSDRDEDGDGPSEAWMDAGIKVQAAVHEWLVAGGVQATIESDLELTWEWHTRPDGDKRDWGYTAVVADVHAEVFTNEDERLILNLWTDNDRLEYLWVDLTEQFDAETGPVAAPVFAMLCAEATIHDGWL